VNGGLGGPLLKKKKQRHKHFFSAAAPNALQHTKKN
jgi:hypothetical protein